MSFLSYYDAISFEEKISASHVQIIVKINDEKTGKKQTIFNRKLHFLLFLILIIIAIIPVFILLFSFYILSSLKKEEREMSYEETKAYFASGKGYLNNLSVEDRTKLMEKMENTPFGL